MMNVVNYQRITLLLCMLFFKEHLAEDIIYFTDYGADRSFEFTCNTTVQFNGNNVDSNKVTLENNNLTVTDIRQEDEGEYKCGDTTIKLQKGLSPVLEKGLPTSKVYQPVGEDFELSCSFKSKPLSRIKWYFNGKDINSNDLFDIHESNPLDDLSTSVLKKNATTGDTGTFKCQVVNDFYTDSILDSSTQVNTFEMNKLKVTIAETKSTSIQVRLNEHSLDEEIPDYRVVMKVFKIIGENKIEKVKEKEVRTNLELFEGLLSYTRYRVEAQEFFKQVPGNLARIEATTSEAAPSAPVGINFNEISKDFVIVTWKKPTNENGKLTGYNLTYTFQKGNSPSSQSVTIDGGETLEHKLTGLYAYVDYTIGISAKTVAYGNIATRVVRTLEGKPAAPEGLTVTDINSSSVRVSWEPIPNYLRGGILIKYVVNYEADAEVNVPGDKKTTKPDQSTIVLSDLKPFKEYKIKVGAVLSKTFGNTSEFRHKTLQGAPSRPLGVRVTPQRTNPSYHGSNDVVEHFFKVKWAQPAETNGEILGFQIRYQKIRSLGTKKRRSIDEYEYVLKNFTGTPTASDREHMIKGVLPYSEYEVQVRELTVAWGPYSDPVRNSTMQGNASPPTNVTQTELTHNSISFSFRPPAHPNGKITRYSLHLRANNDEKSREIQFVNLNRPKVITANRLEPNTVYSAKFLAFTDGILPGESILFQFTTLETPAGFPWHFVLIGCLATVLLVVLIIAVVLLLGRRKKRYEKVRQPDQIDLTAINKSKLISITELKDCCVKQHANSDHGFQQEFESVRIPVHTFTWENSLLPANLSKNRYSNIVAYDHSRVILTEFDGDPCSTYINANFINGYQQQKKFIAAQGPLAETVLDFWRMVWEQNTGVIVMLTRLVEDNKVKCEQYWPEGKALQYNDIVVTVNSVSEMTDYAVRVFTLHKVNNPELGKREVRQFHYRSWPDHGVPSHPTSMLSFVRHVMSVMDSRRGQDGPVIVHCSAGVGRTGTFIAIETGLRQISHDQNVDIYGTVCRMRMQRNFMVQIEAQYIFLYDALLDSVICGITEITPRELVAKIRFNNLSDPKTGKSNFYEEFKRLETGMVSTDFSFSDASHPENKQKNRYLNILPYNHNRVKLVPIAGSRQSDYINASMVDGFQQRNAFIATQAPLENTVVDFWRMIQEKNVHVIVMLTKLVEKEQDKCYLYWPQAGTVSYGAIYVELVNVLQEGEYTVIHELRLTNRETGKSWTVKHFMYLGWPDTGSPSSGSEFINLIASVQRAQLNVQEISPTLVHCSGGVGRTGSFISVFNAIEKLRSSNVVDIFQTIRQLRLQRVAMVQTLDQYIFCYTAAKDYLDSFDHYSNPEC